MQTLIDECRHLEINTSTDGQPVQVAKYRSRNMGVKRLNFPDFEINRFCRILNRLQFCHQSVVWRTKTNFFKSYFDDDIIYFWVIRYSIQTKQLSAYCLHFLVKPNGCPMPLTESGSRSTCQSTADILSFQTTGRHLAFWIAIYLADDSVTNYATSTVDNKGRLTALYIGLAVGISLNLIPSTGDLVYRPNEHTQWCACLYIYIYIYIYTTLSMQTTRCQCVRNRHYDNSRSPSDQFMAMLYSAVWLEWEFKRL